MRKKLNSVAGKKLKDTFGGKLRLFCIGGSALAEDVERFLIEADFSYLIGYGLTETSPLVTGTDNFNVRFRAAGPPLEGIRIKIDNPDKDSGEGEVLIYGPSVMKGYYKDHEETAKVLIEDGWFRSGDLGSIDKDGYLFLATQKIRPSKTRILMRFLPQGLLAGYYGCSNYPKGGSKFSSRGLPKQRLKKILRIKEKYCQK